MTLSHLPIEHELLIACSRTALTAEESRKIESLLKTPLDWQEFQSLARRHQVTSLVIHCLQNAGLDGMIPSEVRDKMRDFAMANLARNLIRQVELNSLLDDFDAQDIFAVVLKGAALSHLVYPNESVRIYADIDLLIPKERLNATKSAMLDHGYSLVEGNYPVPDQKNEELGCEWTYIKESHIIEIHWNIVDRLSPFNIVAKELLDRAVPFQLKERTCYSLSPEDELLHLCIHQFKHHWYQLRDLCDVSELLVTYETVLNWDTVLSRSALAKADKCIFYTLLLCRNVLKTKVPLEVMTELEKRVHPGVMSRSIFELIQKNITAYSSPHAYWPLILVDGFRAKLVIVREAIHNQSGDGDSSNGKEQYPPEAENLHSKLLLTIHSLTEYRRMLSQLAMILLRNVFRRASG